MPVAVEGRLITVRVAQEREERVDVLTLVVAPQRGVVGLSARAVHKPAFRAVDAFGGPDLGEAELVINRRIRSLKDKGGIQGAHERHSGGIFITHIRDGHFLPAVSIGLERCLKINRLLRFQDEGAASEDIASHDVGTVHATVFRRFHNLLEFRNIHNHRLPRDVPDAVGLAKHRKGGAREYSCGDFDHRSRRVSDLAVDVGVAEAVVADSGKRAVQSHLLG